MTDIVDPFDRRAPAGGIVDPFDTAAAAEPSRPAFEGLTGRSLLKGGSDMGRTILDIFAGLPAGTVDAAHGAFNRGLNAAGIGAHHPETVTSAQDAVYKGIDDLTLTGNQYLTTDPSTMGTGAKVVDMAAHFAGNLPNMLAAPSLFLADAAMTPGTRAIDQGKDLGTAYKLAGINLASNAAFLKLPATALPLMAKLGIAPASKAGQTLAQVLTGATLAPAAGIPAGYAEKGVLDSAGYHDEAAAINPLDPLSLAFQAATGGAFGYRESLHTPSPGARPTVEPVVEPPAPANAPESSSPPKAPEAGPADPVSAIVAALTGEPAASIRAPEPAAGGTPEPIPTAAKPRLRVQPDGTFAPVAEVAPVAEPAPAPIGEVLRGNPADVPPPSSKVGMDAVEQAKQADLTPDPVVPDAVMWTNKKEQAVQTPDGVWYHRLKKSGQWQDWTPNAKVEPALAGMTKHVPESGSVTIPGKGKLVIGEKSAPKPKADPSQPLHLLQKLARGVGLNREAFRAAGINPDYFGHREGASWLFRTGDKGMTPNGLREQMQADNTLNPDDPNATSTVGDSEAIDVLQRALDGEKVYSPEDAQRVADQQASDQADHENAIAEAERMFPDMDAAEHDKAARMAAVMADAHERGIDTHSHDASEPDDAYVQRLTDEIAAKEKSNDPGTAQPTGSGSKDGEVPVSVETPARSAGPVTVAGKGDTATPASGGGESQPAGKAAAEVAPEDIGTARDPSPIESTSTKNAVRDAERQARGEDPIIPDQPEGHAEVLAKAQSAIAEDNLVVARAIDKLRNEGNQSISVEEEAILTVHKAKLMNAANDAAARATDPKAAPEDRAQAKREWDRIEAMKNEVDEATSASGRIWGQWGAWRQRQIRADMSLEGMERRARVAGNGKISVEDHAIIKRQAEAIQKLNDQLDAIAEKGDVEGAKATMDALERDMVRESRAPAARKPRPVLDKLKASADEARAALAAMEGVQQKGPRGRKQSGAVINPVVFVHLTKIGAYHIANGAAKLADFIARMKTELGGRFRQYEPNMADVHKAALAMHAEAKKEGKSVASPADVAGKITDVGKLTHADVYALARAHVIAGVRGEGPVMAATHADLVKLGSKLTERDVRRMFSDYGKAKFPSKDADKVELRQVRALVQLQESIDRAMEGLAPLKSGVQRDKATQAIREKRRVLNDLLKREEAKSGPDPKKLATYMDARRTNLKNQIADLQKQIDTGERPGPRTPAPKPAEDVQRLIEQRDRKKAEVKAIDDALKPQKTPEEVKQDTQIKSLRKRLGDIQARVKADDYTRRAPRVTTPLNAEGKKLTFELSEERRKFAIKLYAIEQAQLPPLSRAFNHTRSGLNLARAVMTSFDLSATLRQGGFITFGDPKALVKNFMPMLRAAVSAKVSHDIHTEIATRPNAENYKRDGLFISDAESVGLNAGEEAFLGRWLNPLEEKGGSVRRGLTKAANLPLGIVRGSGRAYITMLNLLRADTYDTLAATLGRSHVITKEEGAAIANFVNVATGRGKIGLNQKANAANPILNTVFFAPRLVASRFNLLFGQPLYGPIKSGNAQLTALLAARYARFLSGVAVTVGLAALARSDDDKKEPFTSMDPRSGNFGKFRFHHSYVDPLAGLGQTLTFVARIATGEKVSTKGKLSPIRPGYRLSDAEVAAGMIPNLPYSAKPSFKADDTVDILTRFGRTKLAPVPGAILNTLTGTTPTGQSTDAVEQAVNIATPMTLRNVYDQMRDSGVPEGTALWAVDSLGMSVQFRDPDSYTKDKQP